MKKAIPMAFYTVLALTLLGPTAKAQYYTIKFVNEAKAPTSTTFISPNAMRGTTADFGAGELDVIDRIDSGTIIWLNHQTKTYKEGSVQEIKSYLDQQSNKMSAAMRDPKHQEMLRRMGGTQESTLEKLGPGGTIAGYPTQRYLLKGPMMQAELWITQSLQFPAAYYRDFNILNGVSTPFGRWDKILDLHGVILKRVVTLRAGGVVLSEIAISVDKSSIPASIFEIPAGYKKVAFRIGEH